MVRAKYYSKRLGSRHQHNKYVAQSSNNHNHNYGRYDSSKMSTRRSSLRGREPVRARYNSIDSLYSRDSSYDRLIKPSKYTDMSRGRHRPPHYDRMVCEAVARLKSRKGCSIRDIVKNLENKYPDALKGKRKGTAEKIVATAKRLVKEGKLVKDGSHYHLSKTSSRSKDSDDYYYDDDSSPRSHSGGKRSYSPQSSKRGRPRKRSRSRSESRSRSRSQSSPPHKTRRRTVSYRKRKRGSRSYKTSTRRRGGWKRGSKRKKGSRKGQTRLATGKRGPYRKRVTRARRRVKHSHTKRPKPEKLPEGDSSQNKGWFGGWFGGRGGADGKSTQGKDKGSSSKGETKKSKSSSEQSTGKETRGV